MEKVDKKAVLFKSSYNAKTKKIDVKKMKIGFWVEFECQGDVNEIRKNRTKAHSGEFCVISLFLRKRFKGYVTF